MKADITILKSNKVDLKTKNIIKDKECHFIMMKLIYNNPKYESI